MSLKLNGETQNGGRANILPIKTQPLVLFNEQRSTLHASHSAVWVETHDFILVPVPKQTTLNDGELFQRISELTSLSNEL